MERYRLSDLSREGMADLCSRNPVADPSIMETCRTIFDDVSGRGDEALREYTRRFDDVELTDIQVTDDEFSRAGSMVSASAVAALERAARNVRAFHSSQPIAPHEVQVEAGITCWRESRPIDSVGLYVPGGNAVLPSTVLMLGIPARLAGCSEIVLCVPPAKDGTVSAEVLVAATISGVDQVFKIGGAQAVAAMALGTESVARVDKILGPGNRWVQAAKLLASLGGTAIDMVAGPSEVLVVADDSACPEWVAGDLISQAEHGSDSQASLVSISPSVLEAVETSVGQQLQDLPRKDFASESLRHSFSLLADSTEEAIEFANQYAPEHLILHVNDPRCWGHKVRNAGSVFLGPWSPEVAGDYASGTNHTLPTSGLARAFSGVSWDSFVKMVTFQELTREGLQSLAPTLETLAALEGLEGHRRAVAARLSSRDESEIKAVEAGRPRTPVDATSRGSESSTTPHREADIPAQIRRLIRPNILELEPYHSAREKALTGVLLDANEHPYAQYLQGVQLNRYPDPFQYRLRELIGDYAGVDVGNVVAGAGSDEVLDWIFKVFCQPGQDRVAIAHPTYGMYQVTADVFGVGVFEFSLDERFDFNPEEFLSAVPPDIKVLFLCSPNNPTGNLLNRDQILHLCRTWDRIVVVDEAYVEFADQPSLAMELGNIPNLILLRTLSKAFGRAALRLGYAIASEAIISQFLRVKAPYNLNALTMENGCQVLMKPARSLSLLNQIREERQRLATQLSGLPTILKVLPSQANFLLFCCAGATRICGQLLDRGVVIRDRSRLPGLENAIRVSVGTPAENDRFLKELTSVLPHQ